MAQTSKPASAHPKRVYRSPVFKTYGAIRELTTGGSVGPPEGAGVGNKDKIINPKP
jgi:hypothetical protein